MTVTLRDQEKLNSAIMYEVKLGHLSDPDASRAADSELLPLLTAHGNFIEPNHSH